MFLLSSYVVFNIIVMNGLFFKTGREINVSLCLTHYTKIFYLFLDQQRVPWGRLQKSKLAFSSHIFLIKVWVFTFEFALSKGMLNAKRWDFEKKKISVFFFSFPDRNMGGWLIKSGGWLNPETQHSSSSLPWALIFSLSSSGPYLHPRVQQRQWSPCGGLVSGLRRMEMVPGG